MRRSKVRDEIQAAKRVGHGQAVRLSDPDAGVPQPALRESRKEIGRIARADISVLFPDKSTSRDFAHEQHTKAPEGATAGVGAGGLVGGTLGLLAGLGVLVIPGVGPILAAGPLMVALGGIAMHWPKVVANEQHA